MASPWTTAVSLTALAVLVGACRFSPEVASGTRACGTNEACPAGLVCHQGICCAPGDEQGRCKTAPPDKRDAARTMPSTPSGTDGGGSADALADGSGGPEVDAARVDLDAAAPDARGDEVTAVTVTKHGSFPTKLLTLKDDCSKAPPAAGKQEAPERWCAFLHAELPELWVLNVTRAARAPVRCDGTDPNCLRLHTKAHHEPEDQTSYVNPFFWGDLLIFYEQPTSAPNQEYRGTIYAWLPGWSTPRPLTSNKGMKCRGANADPTRWGPGIWCLDNAVPSGEADLLVTSTPLMPFTKVARLGRSEVRVAALDNGAEYFAYRTPAPGRGELKVVATKDAADPGKYVTVAGDVADWQMSVDGRAIYLLRPNGRLSWVDTRNPTMETDLALRITRFVALLTRDGRDMGVTAVQDEVGSMGVVKFYFSRTATREVDVGRNSTIAWDISDDMRYSALQPTVSNDTLYGTIVVVDHGTNGQCTLQSKLTGAVLPPGSFSPNNRWVAWGELVRNSFSDDVYLANPKDCSDVHLVGRKVSQYDFLGDRGLLHIEGQTETGGTLQYRAWGKDGSFPETPPISVQAGVGMFAPAAPGLYVLSASDPGNQGIYVLQLPESLQ